MNNLSIEKNVKIPGKNTFIYTFWGKKSNKQIIFFEKQPDIFAFMSEVLSRTHSESINNKVLAFVMVSSLAIGMP